MLHRRHRILVGDHAAADDPIVVVAVLPGGDGQAGADAVAERLVGVDVTVGQHVGVALEASAHPVVAQPAQQQQPGGLYRSGGQHNPVGPHRPLALLGAQLNLAPAIVDPGRQGVAQDVGPGGGRSGEQGVVDAVLGIDWAGVAYALGAVRTCGPPAVGPGVDQQGNGCGGPPQAGRGLGQHLSPSVGRERGKRVAPGPGPVTSVSGSTGHPHLPLHQVVVGLKVVVGDGPVGQGRALGDAVLAGHAECLWREPPPLATVQPRAAPQHHGVVVIAEIVGLDGLLTVAAPDGPGISSRGDALAEPEDGGAVVAHRVPADFCGFERPAPPPPPAPSTPPRPVRGRPRHRPPRCRRRRRRSGLEPRPTRSPAARCRPSPVRPTGIAGSPTLPSTPSRDRSASAASLGPSSSLHWDSSLSLTRNCPSKARLAGGCGSVRP